MRPEAGGWGGVLDKMHGRRFTYDHRPSHPGARRVFTDQAYCLNPRAGWGVGQIQSLQTRILQQKAGHTVEPAEPE